MSHTRAEVTVTPGKAEAKDGRATLRLTEATSLFYPDARDDEPKAEEYALDHTLTFTRGATGGWALAADLPDLGTGDVTTYLAPPKAEKPAEGSEDEGGRPARSGTARPAQPANRDKPTLAAGYDYWLMTDYANKYWKHANSDYRTYGNDCTNFVSQAVHAGGWRETSGSIFNRKSNKKWFYGSHTWTTSYTWAGAENWYWFATKHSQRTKSLDNVWKLSGADVLQADWDRDNTIDHTMIVTAANSQDVYLTYHTSNTHNRKLSNLLAKHPHTWWYAHRT